MSKSYTQTHQQNHITFPQNEPKLSSYVCYNLKNTRRNINKTHDSILLLNTNTHSNTHKQTEIYMTGVVVVTFPPSMPWLVLQSPYDIIHT